MIRRSLAAALTLGALSACSSDQPVPTGMAASASRSSSTSLAGAERQHLVVFKNRVPEGVEANIASLGGSIVARMDQIGVLSVAGLSDAAVASLARSEGVQAVDIDPEVSLDRTELDTPESMEGAIAAGTASDEGHSPANPALAGFYARQWHLRQIQANTAWAAGKLGSASTKVFILDTGIDPTHPDLVGRVDASLSKSFVPRDNAWRADTASAYWKAQPEWVDYFFHGTHVAATVSSNASAAAGVTSGVTLVAVKVLSWTGSSQGSSVIQGMLYAADNDADVINMSLGGGFLRAGGNGAAMHAINRAVSYVHQKGTLVVVSAGNSNLDLQHMNNYTMEDGTTAASYFSTYCDAPNVICVSATGPTSRAGTNGPWFNIDTKASYSNYGNKIFVAAPGGNGASTVTAACSKYVRPDGPNASLAVCATGTFVVGSNGTSMASPHVTGLAALLVEKVGHNNPAQLRAAVKAATDDLGAVDRDPVYGFGRINVAKGLGL
jgi:lantibiotic leader peptide-processing serine protease